MNEKVASSVPRSLYKKRSEKVLFTFPAGRTSFQTGHLGAEPSGVEGTLQLRYPANQPLFASKITISLVGKEYVKWAEHHGQATVVYTDKRCLLNEKDTVWDASYPELSASTGNNSGDTATGVEYRPITSLDIPFQFSLGQDLPNTVHVMANRGRVVYKLIATIHRKRSVNNLFRNEKRVSVRCPIKRYEAVPLPISGAQLTLLPSDAAATRGIRYDVKLPKVHFSPGEEFLVPVRLSFSDSHVYLKKIMLKLTERRELRAKHRKITQKRALSVCEIMGDAVPMLRDNECVTELRVQIPEEKERHGEVVDGKDNRELRKERKRDGHGVCVCTVTNLRCVKVSHWIKVKILLGKTSDIKLVRECVIANYLETALPQYSVADEQSLAADELQSSAVNEDRLTPPPHYEQSQSLNEL